MQYLVKGVGLVKIVFSNAYCPVGIAFRVEIQLSGMICVFFSHFWIASSSPALGLW